MSSPAERLRRVPEREGRRRPFGRVVGAVRKRLLREPLVHFLVLGGVLFGAYFLEREPGTDDASSKEIRLTVDDLAQLLMVFESKWRRQPTEEEFTALVDDRVREDVLYREALTLGLDKEDEIVKRRMAQKMKFLAEDVATAREPTTEELRSWFTRHSGLFATPARYSFRHLYFSPDRRGGAARDDAADALTKLAGQPQGSALATSLGDAFMFQDYYGDRAPQAIAREFGPEFAQAVEKLAPGAWQGPVKSGYGWHLVFVDTVIPGRIPAFEEVAEDVKTAWLGEQKAEAWQKAYDEMRSKYTVLLPVPADDSATASNNAAAPPAAPTWDEGTPR
jgi:peptidyl-prolyl cis-trans isomerase C